MRLPEHALRERQLFGLRRAFAFASTAKLSAAMTSTPSGPRSSCDTTWSTSSHRDVASARSARTHLISGLADAHVFERGDEDVHDLLAREAEIQRPRRPTVKWA